MRHFTAHAAVNAPHERLWWVVVGSACTVAGASLRKIWLHHFRKRFFRVPFAAHGARKYTTYGPRPQNGPFARMHMRGLFERIEQQPQRRPPDRGSHTVIGAVPIHKPLRRLVFMMFGLRWGSRVAAVYANESFIMCALFFKRLMLVCFAFLLVPPVRFSSVHEPTHCLTRTQSVQVIDVHCVCQRALGCGAPQELHCTL